MNGLDPHWSDIMAGQAYAASRSATAPFLVFADAPGFRPPSVKHLTRTQAETEARRLAELNPGINYFVLGSLSVSSVAKPKANTRNLV